MPKQRYSLCSKEGIKEFGKDFESTLQYYNEYYF